MICPNCKNDIPEGTKFCTSCGYSVPEAAPVAQSVAQPAPQQAPQPAYNPQPSYAQPQASYASASGYAQPQQASYTPSAPVVHNPIPVIGYIGLFLLSSFPFIGFLAMVIMGAVAKNKNIKNFCWAMVIITIIMAVIGVIVGIALSAQVAQMGSIYEELQPFIVQ